jgi:predicted AAA+ superfamily ATPase
MPEVVKEWIQSKDIKKCQSIQANIVNSYRQDFGKYAKKHQLKYIDIIFDRIPALLAQKIKYSNISNNHQTRDLAPCLDLLIKAGIIHQVFHTSSQAPPLGANVDLKHFKAIFLDIGLAQSILKLDLGDWILNPKRTIENKGNIVEAFIGQELIAYSNPEEKTHLYYWHRESAGSKAEIDYVIQKNSGLIPIEVKSGISGGLKSLIIYIKSIKKSYRGVHFSQRSYERKKLYSSLPLYMVAKLNEEKTLPPQLIFFPGKALAASDMNYLVDFIINTAKLYELNIETSLKFEQGQTCTAQDANQLLKLVNIIYKLLDLKSPEWSFNEFTPGTIMKSEDMKEIVRKVTELQMF